MKASSFGWLVLSAACGCSGGPYWMTDRRPVSNPPPKDVQAEIRDARYFLPIPDARFTPQTGLEMPTMVKPQGFGFN